MPYNSVSKPVAHVPENIIRAVMSDVETTSVALSLGRVLNVPTSNNVIPLPITLPEAYWTDAERPEPKQTTHMEWSREVLRVYELAALMLIPDAYIEDVDVPIWDEVRPYITQAISRKLDAAVLFGNDKPAGDLVSVYEHAARAGNLLGVPPEPDPPEERDVVPYVLRAMRMVSEDGFSVTGLATRPGFQWEIAAGRVNSLQFDPSQPISGRLFGLPFATNDNGGWDDSKAHLLAGKWDNLYVGVRRDIQIELTNTGVIRDPATGEVTVSAWQDDVTIMRVTFRAGWKVLNPANPTEPDEDKRSPFAVLSATGSPS